MQINVKHNIDQIQRRLTGMQKKQVPFATAKALTMTAQDAQKEIQAMIPSRFNVTKKWWLKQQPTGIKITPATKARLVATVYTRAYFAGLQEDGGTKGPHKGRKLAIPTERVPKSKRKSGGAAQMMAGKRVFATPNAIYRRKGKGKNSTIERLFTLKPTAHIKARFGFESAARAAARQRFSRNFVQALNHALRTAR